MAYLFLLLAICCAAPALKVRHNFIKSLGNDYYHVIRQIPDISIVNGQVTLKQLRPLFISRKDGIPVAVIDTTGATNFIYEDNIIALLTKDKFIVRLGRNKFNTLDLSGITEFRADKEIFAEWLIAGKKAFAPLSYGIFLMLSYIFAVLALLVVAMVGLILALGMHASLHFAAIMRIAAVAATPAILLVTFSAAFGAKVPDLLYLGCTLGYLTIGIKACTKPEPEEDAPKIDLMAMLHEESGENNGHSHA